MQAISADNSGEDECPSRDPPEGEIGFLHEVFKIHAIKASNEGARTNSEGANRKFEVEEHKGVAVSVEDDIDAKLLDMSVLVEWRRRGVLHLLGVSNARNQIA